MSDWQEGQQLKIYLYGMDERIDVDIYISTCTTASISTGFAMLVRWSLPEQHVNYHVFQSSFIDSIYSEHVEVSYTLVIFYTHHRLIPLQFSLLHIISDSCYLQLFSQINLTLSFMHTNFTNPLKHTCLISPLSLCKGSIFKAHILQPCNTTSLLIHNHTLRSFAVRKKSSQLLYQECLHFFYRF